MHFLLSHGLVYYNCCFIELLLHLLDTKSLVDNNVCFKMVEVYLACYISSNVMYCVYRVPRSSLLIESNDCNICYTSFENMYNPHIILCKFGTAKNAC